MKNVIKEQLAIGSIRTRLTLFYTLAVFVLLGLVTIFLYWITINLLYKADYEFLSDEVETIQYILENKSSDPNLLKHAVITAPVAAKNSMYRYYVRVFDHKNRVLIATPGSDLTMPTNQFIFSLLNSEKKHFYWYKNDGQHYLSIESPIRLGKSNRFGYVQITLDVSYQHSVVHDKKNIFIALLFISLISTIFGFLITQRGLRSLYVLTDTVQRITDTSLDQRINPTSWPKELRSLSKAFNQMLDRIETSFNKLKQFSSDLSHELRTPITNMIGQTEVALSYEYSVEEYQKVMESNLEELQRMSSLVENILFLARTESPQLHLKKSRLDVRHEIEVICDYYLAMAEDKNIRIHISGDGDIDANSDLFRRVISNLLSNAIKYTLQNGHVYFTIESLESSLRINIRDTGVGIASEHIPRLFERFFRVDAARSNIQSGVGLGLPIVKSIVDIHHGSINVTSQEGIGTCVTLLFPK